MTIGERIKDKRIELNLSQDELAKKVGYKSRSSIQKIESARDLPLNKVELMARALECSPSYLMGWEDEDGNQTTLGQVGEAYEKRALLDQMAAYDNETLTKAVELFNRIMSLPPADQTALLTLLESLQKKP